MADFEYDLFVVCPTCRRIERPGDHEEEDAHLQPCPGCGFALMQVRYEVWDEGDREVSICWNAGEGAQLYLDDAEKAIACVDEFVADEEAEDDRVEDALDTIRCERQREAS
jgi:hypothetical protein